MKITKTFLFAAVIGFILVSSAQAYLNVIDLGTLGGSYSEARSINDSGQIVGSSYLVSDYYEHATLFDQTGSGNNIDLGTLGGGWSTAISLNNNGQIVGWARTGSNAEHATLFDSTGNKANIDLGTLGGAYGSSSASSINDNGQIVGNAYNSSGQPRPCLFDSTDNGNNIDLGTLGGPWGYAWSINDVGQIVGTAATTPTGSLRAALFDPTGQGNNINLNTLIDPSSGWTLTDAWCINNNGWVVGYGINPDGYGHAYLLTPEPATILLLGLGAMLWRKKR